MKATLDIPDDLYRRVKTRSALKGRPLRTVAMELFQRWLDAPQPSPSPQKVLTDKARAPWLEITRKHVQPGMRHDPEAIRKAIATGWSAEITEKLQNSAK